MTTTMLTIPAKITEPTISRIHFRIPKVKFNKQLHNDDSACSDRTEKYAVTDPGFHRGGGANSPGAPTYDFAKISQKLHEIERI